MNSRLLYLLPLLLCFCACAPTHEWYPPPVQYGFRPDAEPRIIGAFAAMEDPLAENYILSGVLHGEPGSSWRWANEKVDLRFQLGDVKPTRFVVDFVIPHSTFKLTGPVKMTLKIDGKPVGSMAVDKPGEQHWSVPVDPSQYNPVTQIVATIEVDKFYTSETDGTKLGFMLMRAGFQQ